MALDTYLRETTAHTRIHANDPPRLLYSQPLQPLLLKFGSCPPASAPPPCRPPMSSWLDSHLLSARSGRVRECTRGCHTTDTIISHPSLMVLPRIEHPLEPRCPSVDNVWDSVIHMSSHTPRGLYWPLHNPLPTPSRRAHLNFSTYLYSPCPPHSHRRSVGLGFKLVEHGFRLGTINEPARALVTSVSWPR